MKTILQITILFLFTQSCQSQEQDFNVKYENFEINIPGSPGPWLKHNGKFYCYFTTDNDKFSSGSTHHFYILDKNGKTESKITVPDKLQTFYYDLYVKNDTIFTTEYYDQNTFYLKNNKWIETKKAIDLFYEDNNYDVYSLDFGEWGGVTWFNDKKTNKQYEFAGSSPIINKLENAYFVTLGNKILKIANPQKMELSKEPYDYKKAVLTEDYFRQGSNSLKGAEIIYEYKNDDYFNPKFSFATSFISNNKLYHIYKDSISTKIGITEDNKLVKVYDFTKEIIPYQWSYDWRNQIQKNKYQTIQFSTKRDNEYGILEINENDILVTTFKNIFKENELGEAKMKQWFEKTFDYYFSNFHKLFLKDIDSIELKEDARDLTQNHKMSHYLLDGKDIETPRVYRKLENSIFKLNTMYYYGERDTSIQLIEFEWGKNKSSFKNEVDFSVAESMSKDKYVYEPKFVWLSEFLSAKLGNPITSKLGDKSGLQEWEIENKVIKLQYNTNLCELTMYKK
ncbi:hypothetical protein [Chryseobacterium sp. Leaf394]|uniref:hypothetical protein n=1 Tax=Chryseobacterium sp. Leaf394 TaxID=1736361 RepID=UPI0006F6B872|nr:hypothetical protein [Chryseobacterium sp. Leaf394]KQS88526.1 hypothetical protein ASG21_17050 [Chryseobacterium sp. Leaf394]